MKPIIFITSALLSVILYSCTTAYIPTELNTPAFHDANDFRGAISYGVSGTNLQLGYAFHKHLAITGDISYLHTFGSRPEFQRSQGLALGYFTSLDKKQTYMEIFGGFHVAETRSTNNGTNEFGGAYTYENSRYYTLYLQPDISFPFGFIELIFAARMKYMNFSSYEMYNKPNTVPPKAFALEPAFTIRMGSEYIKLKYQIGLSYMGILSGSEFNYDHVFSHVGLAVSF